MKAYKYFFTVSAMALTTFALSSSPLQASKSNYIEDEIGKNFQPTILINFKSNDELSYESLKKALNNQHSKYEILLNSSQNKDIVVFFGKTGAGKSTLINYLSGKQLIVEDDDITLSEKSKKDPSAMEIGTGDSSQTTYPKSIQYDDLLLYDFPGFGDTRGLEADFLNASFTKNILEKAKSVRVVFVAGAGEIEEGRGESLKRLIKIAGDLMKESSIKDLSSLVITKGRFKTVEMLGTRIKQKCGTHSILEEWIDKGRLAQMSRPQGGKIKEDEGELILNSIKKSKPTPLKNLALDVIIKGIMEDEINKLYVSARAEHTIQIKKKLSLDNNNIDEKGCFNYKASETDRDHSKKIAGFLRHVEALEEDELIEYLKSLQPRRYETEVKTILDLYIPYDTKEWAAKMSETYEEDKEKCWKSLSSKQRGILTQYIFPSVDKGFKFEDV